MAIVLWIGLVITAQAFQSTPRSHAPAVVVGILPGVAAWGALMLKHGVRAASGALNRPPPFGAPLLQELQKADLWAQGAFALEQGFIFTAMFLAAMTVEIIERRFRRAALWAALCAAGSALGLMHAWRFTPGDTVQSLAPAWPWALGYALMATLLLAAPLITRPGEGH